MRKVIGIFLLVYILAWPSSVLAAGFTMNIQFMCQDDGTACSELWYNDKVVWRLALLADGAKPVSGSYNKSTTIIAPDVINGLFVIKVQ